MDTLEAGDILPSLAVFKQRASKIISHNGLYTISRTDTIEDEGVLYHVVLCSNWDNAIGCPAGLSACTEGGPGDSVLVVGAGATHDARCQPSEPLPSSLLPDLLLSESVATTKAKQYNKLQHDTKANELTYPQTVPSSPSSALTSTAYQQQSNERGGSVVSTSVTKTVEAAEPDSPFEIGRRFQNYNAFYKVFQEWYNDLYPRSALTMSLQKSPGINKTRYYPRCADLSNCDFRLTLHTIVGESTGIITRADLEHSRGCPARLKEQARAKQQGIEDTAFSTADTRAFGASKEIYTIESTPRPRQEVTDSGILGEAVTQAEEVTPRTDHVVEGASLAERQQNEPLESPTPSPQLGTSTPVTISSLPSGPSKQEFTSTEIIEVTLSLPPGTEEKDEEGQTTPLLEGLVEHAKHDDDTSALLRSFRESGYDAIICDRLEMHHIHNIQDMITAGLRETDFEELINFVFEEEPFTTDKKRYLTKVELHFAKKQLKELMEVGGRL